MDVVLSEEPDENDEPREMIEFGLWVSFAVSDKDVETELLNFGAVGQFRFIFWQRNVYNQDNLPFSNCRKLIERSLI